MLILSFLQSARRMANWIFARLSSAPLPVGRVGLRRDLPQEPPKLFDASNCRCSAINCDCCSKVGGCPKAFKDLGNCALLIATAILAFLMAVSRSACAVSTATQAAGAVRLAGQALGDLVFLSRCRRALRCSNVPCTIALEGALAALVVVGRQAADNRQRSARRTHLDAIHRAGGDAQVKPCAFVDNHCVHPFGGADDGVTGHGWMNLVQQCIGFTDIGNLCRARHGWYQFDDGTSATAPDPGGFPARGWAIVDGLALGDSSA